MPTMALGLAVRPLGTAPKVVVADVNLNRKNAYGTANALTDTVTGCAEPYLYGDENSEKRSDAPSDIGTMAPNLKYTCKNSYIDYRIVSWFYRHKSSG